MILQHEYQQRRQKLLQQLTEQSLAIIPGATNPHRGEFRQHPDFYYLTGYNYPNAVCILLPSEHKYILFVEQRCLEQQQWEGKLPNLQQTQQTYHVDQVYLLADLETWLMQQLRRFQTLYYGWRLHADLDDIIHKTLQHAPRHHYHHCESAFTIINIHTVIHHLRLFKSPAELQLIRQASSCAAHAHCALMRACQPAMNECQLEAIFRYHCLFHHGYRQLPYAPIIASGKNTGILHYNDNNQDIHEGVLVLVDAATEHDYYGSDISRTFPANGKFSAEQRAIYQLVLATQQHCIDHAKPGVAFSQLQHLAVEQLTQGLIELGLLNTTFDEAIETRAYRQFYMHGVSHWLGLETHDVGPYQQNNQSITLQPNMVLTIEPGIYIQENAKPPWHHIGVRIEDVIIITHEGAEVITDQVPKQIEAIEALMQS